MLGLYLKDEKRLVNHAAVLVEPGPADRAPIPKAAAAVATDSGSQDMFALLDELLTELAREGFRIRYSAAIFIKSQLTIAGILKELDPDFDQDDYVMGASRARSSGRLGPRLLRTVWFPSWELPRVS
jgi:predicted unusual protein kinase regulating ubiquinone biosynthesis (AarF/ABC1/UbiB family)